MKTIKVYQVPITDLSQKYAIETENGVTHYRFGIESLVNKMTQEQHLAQIKTLIESEQGSVDLVFEPPKNQQTMPKPVEFEAMLSKHSGIKKALLKRKSSRLILETVIFENNTFLNRIHDKIASIWNKFAYYINDIYKNFQIRKLRKSLNIPKVFDSRKIDFSQLKTALPYMNYKVLIKGRNITPAQHLAVCFEEGQEKQAVDLMLNDLKLLHDRGLIEGHLLMPSILPLVNEYGLPQKRYALYCILFADTTDKGLNLQTLTQEGAIGKSIAPTVSVETVDMFPSNYEKNRESVIQHYQETLDAVNKAAENSAKRYKKHKEERKS